MENLLKDIELFKIATDPKKIDFPDNIDDPRMEQIQLLSERNTTRDQKNEIFEKLTHFKECSSSSEESESEDSSDEATFDLADNVVPSSKDISHKTIPEKSGSLLYVRFDKCKNILITGGNLCGKSTLACSIISDKLNDKTGFATDCACYFTSGTVHPKIKKNFLPGFIHEGANYPSIFTDGNEFIDNVIDKFNSIADLSFAEKSCVMLFDDIGRTFLSDRLTSKRWKKFLLQSTNLNAMKIFVSSGFPIVTERSEYMVFGGFDVLLCGKSTNQSYIKSIWEHVAHRFFPSIESFSTCLYDLTKNPYHFMGFALNKSCTMSGQEFVFHCMTVNNGENKFNMNNLYNHNIQQIHKILLNSNKDVPTIQYGFSNFQSLIANPFSKILNWNTINKQPLEDYSNTTSSSESQTDSSFSSTSVSSVSSPESMSPIELERKFKSDLKPVKPYENVGKIENNTRDSSKSGGKLIKLKAKDNEDNKSSESNESSESSESNERNESEKEEEEKDDKEIEQEEEEEEQEEKEEEKIKPLRQESGSFVATAPYWRSKYWNLIKCCKKLKKEIYHLRMSHYHYAQAVRTFTTRASCDK